MSETPWWKQVDESIELDVPANLPPPLSEQEPERTSHSAECNVNSAEGKASPEPEPTAHTWTAVDVIGLGDQPPEPPTIADLFYAGKRHVVSGESEAGKTWLLLAATADELQAEHGVIWVDTDDMGPAAVLERLRCFGVADDKIRDLFAYMRPAEPLADVSRRHVTDLLATLKVRLVALDAFNASLTLHGYDPSSTAEVEQFYRRVVDPFCEQGAAVVLPDHVVKKPGERGKYSYGSERKHSGAQVHIGMQTIDVFGRGRTGRAKLVVHKDRPGFLERPSAGLFVLTSDADSGRCTWELEAARDVSDEGVFRPTALMERVSRYLYVANEPRSRNQIEQDVKGKGAYVRQAIDVLLTEGFASEVSGERGARLVKLVKQYLEEDD